MAITFDLTFSRDGETVCITSNEATEATRGGWDQTIDTQMKSTLIMRTRFDDVLKPYRGLNKN